MEEEKHHDEMLKRTLGSTKLGKNEVLVKEVENLNLDVPQEIMQRIESDVAQSEKQAKTSMNGLIKVFMSVTPEYKGRMWFSVIFACLGEIFSFATYFLSAYVAAWLIKRAGGSLIGFDELLQYAFLVMGPLLLYFVLTDFSTTISYKTSSFMLERLRQTLFEELKVISMGYLVDNPVGEIKMIIIDRVADMEGWITHLMPESPSRLLHPIPCVIILFCLDRRIGLSTFVPPLAILIGMATIMHKYRNRVAVWLSSYAGAADRSAEYVRGIPVIKAFVQDKAPYGKFADAVKFYHFSTTKRWKQSWLGEALMTVTMMTSQIVSMPLALYLCGKGETGIETLPLPLILPTFILPRALTIMTSFELFQMAFNTWASIQELLDMPVQKRPDASKRTVIDNTKGTKFTDVSFSYHDGTEVLHEISLEAKLGEVTALAGPSGGGKSMIAKLLAGLWDLVPGVISPGDADTEKTPFHRLAGEISFVSQGNFLFDVSIRDDIRLGRPDASENETIRAAKAAHCHEFIMVFPGGYETKAGVVGGATSGGERQRMTLARAILKPASTIILDEATAYADPENEALIQEVTSHLVKGENPVVIAYRLSTIRQAHQIILIDKGQIITKGRHDELLQEPLYTSLWRQYLGEE